MFVVIHHSMKGSYTASGETTEGLSYILSTKERLELRLAAKG